MMTKRHWGLFARPLLLFGLAVTLVRLVRESRTSLGRHEFPRPAKGIYDEADEIRGPNRDLMAKNTERSSTNNASETNLEFKPTISSQTFSEEMNDIHDEVSEPLEDVKRTAESVKKLQETRKRLLMLNKPKKPPPAFTSLFNFHSLTLVGNDNPVDFAINVAVERLQRELTLEEALDDQPTVTSRLPDPAPLRGDAAPAHQLLQQQEDSSLRVGSVVPANAARHILIAATWRSGSTFLGDLLTHYPGTFYSFEPLHYQAHDPNPKVESLALLKDLFQCRFDERGTADYVRHASKFAFLFANHNHRLAKVCQNLFPNRAACFVPNLVKGLCDIYPLRLIKTVRLRMSESEALLRDPDLPSLKVVALFRDPRGLMASRASMTWCDTDECANPKRVCQDMEDDVNATFALRERYPERVHLVRYEDLSAQPFEVLRELLAFLDLLPNKSVQRFIETHTKKQEGIGSSMQEQEENPYKTVRDSNATVFAWRSRVDFGYVKRIQDVCQKPMNILGYNFLTSIEDRDKEDFPVISKTRKEVWY